jgi:hypothetical protein
MIKWTIEASDLTPDEAEYLQRFYLANCEKVVVYSDTLLKNSVQGSYTITVPEFRAQGYKPPKSKRELAEELKKSIEGDK